MTVTSEEKLPTSMSAFHGIMHELIWLVDNQAFVEWYKIHQILYDGKDVIQFLEYALPFKQDWSFLDFYDRDHVLEVLIRTYQGGREKHYISKRNGLLRLIELCNYVRDTLDVYQDEKIEFYLGKLSDKELYDIAHMDTKFLQNIRVF